MELLLKVLSKVSPTMANTLFASLSWSGAARFVNDFGKEGAETKAYLYLMSLAAGITAKEVLPTTKGVLELIRTKPLLETPTGNTLKALLATGETQESINVLAKQAYTANVARHEIQMKHLELNILEITKTLDEAFAKKQGKFVAMSEQLESALITKIWEKVEARKSRIVSDVSSGKFVDTSLTELTKINAIIKAENTQKAA